jgi:hypothetical protein
MTRRHLVVIAALAGEFFGLQPAQAYNAPWCAVIQKGAGSVYWDCHGGQPWHLQSKPVLRLQRHRTHALRKTPRSPAVAAPPDMS